MGVRGLTTYINFNQDAFLRDYLLHDTTLIIDGHSLCSQLFHSLNSFAAFGGDYDKFAVYVKNFFKSLKKCNITSYVIFDGSYEKRKLKTAYKRLKSKISGASKLDPVTQGSLQIFPLLVRDVFKEVLQDMGLPFTICEFEADDEIATMARHLNCPVLSYDSDFFIYDVLYIPFKTLERKPKVYEVNGCNCFALECKLYKVQYMTNHFGGLNEELLPLLAILLGNDFVEKRVFKKFFSQLKLHKSKKKKNEQQRCIHALFKWLQNESMESAVSKILGRLKKNEKNKVLTIIKNGIEGYNGFHCQSLKFFNIFCETTVKREVTFNEECVITETENELDSCEELNGTASEDSDVSSENIDDECTDEEFSDEQARTLDWFSNGIRSNAIPQTYSNLFTHHLHFCSPQAENYNDEDSLTCVLPILRYAFDLLTDFSNENFIYVSREKDCHYKKILIGKEYAISKLLHEPFSELNHEQKKLCFKHFIGMKLPNLDLTLIDMLPPNLQLYIISLLYWVANCKVCITHIHSLLLCYVMLEVVDEKTGMCRGHYYFNKKYAAKISEIKEKKLQTKNDSSDELFLNKNKVAYEDCVLATSVLLRYFELDETIRKKPKSYNTERIHVFAQFQCCLQQFNCLNSLCGNPFESTKYSKYNGTFVYNIALKLDTQPDPYTFLLQSLKGADTILKFYTSLWTIYEKSAQKMSLSTVQWSHKKRRRKKCAEKDDISFICKGFESDVII